MEVKSNPKLMKKLFNTITSKYGVKYTRVIKKCLEYNPHDRPTIHEVIKELWSDDSRVYQQY